LGVGGTAAAGSWASRASRVVSSHTDSRLHKYSRILYLYLALV
jgi:hypothetical protein